MRYAIDRRWSLELAATNLGDKQREGLAKDLKKVAQDTPIVVLSHSPLQKIYKGWNFWTEDAEGWNRGVSRSFG